MELYLIGDNMIERKIKKFVTKQPFYSSLTNSYNLDFKGKVPIPSVKNMIIVDSENPSKDLIVFGKSGTDLFYLKV